MLLRSNTAAAQTTGGLWQLSELTHAVLILVHFHTMSSFVYGCGIRPEYDHVTSSTAAASAAAAAASRQLLLDELNDNDDLDVTLEEMTTAGDESCPPNNNSVCLSIYLETFSMKIIFVFLLCTGGFH